MHQISYITFTTVINLVLFSFILSKFKTVIINIPYMFGQYKLAYLYFLMCWKLSSVMLFNIRRSHKKNYYFFTTGVNGRLLQKYRQLYNSCRAVYAGHHIGNKLNKKSVQYNKVFTKNFYLFPTAIKKTLLAFSHGSVKTKNRTCQKLCYN